MARVTRVARVARVARVVEVVKRKQITLGYYISSVSRGPCQLLH